jgi:hypothetical protein
MNSAPVLRNDAMALRDLTQELANIPGYTDHDHVSSDRRGTQTSDLNIATAAAVDFLLWEAARKQEKDIDYLI